MTEPNQNQDPMEFLKDFWAKMSLPLPGMVAPTVDSEELGRRIADLKAVEGWLKSNLSMLQMTIQGLEMQRATLATLHSMRQAAGSGEPTANPFVNSTPWPWNMVAPPSAATGADEPPSKNRASSSPRSSAAKRKPKG